MQAAPVTQVSCENHGGLTASLEVLCQALTDSQHLAVCLELGLKLSNPPTWIEMLSLILRSLEAPARSGPGRDVSNCDVAEVRPQFLRNHALYASLLHHLFYDQHPHTWCMSSVLRPVLAIGPFPRQHQHATRLFGPPCMHSIALQPTTIACRCATRSRLCSSPLAWR